MIFRSGIFLFFVISSLSLLISPVSAYLDPGVGSMVWQLFIALFLGLAYSITKFYRQIKIKITSFFRRERQ